MHYSLFELNEFIRQVLALNLPEPVWVKCELTQVKFSRGHCYLDLVEKGGVKDEVLAQGRAVIWQTQFRRLQNKLGLELDALLQPGMEVLMQAEVDFHERYGLKLIIRDLDPNYTLGQLEMKRRETIQRLDKEGLLEKNRSLPLPRVLQRIAIISSETAAGLQDFLNQLRTNSYGYYFENRLFPASVQGENAGTEIQRQLQKIAPGSFDAIVLIRGGGAKLDLAAFDAYDLCNKLALAPLPVLCGIGHEIDQTVTDLVAHTSLKTPTAVAEFIIQRNFQYEMELLNCGSLVHEASNRTLHEAKMQLSRYLQVAEMQSGHLLRQQHLMLDYIAREIPVRLKSSLKSARSRLESIEKSIQLLSPETAFDRGFSLTQKEGRVVSSASQLKTGDELVTYLKKGSFTSTVKKRNTDD